MIKPDKVVKRRVVRSVSDYVPGFDDRRVFDDAIVDLAGYEELPALIFKFLRGDRSNLRSASSYYEFDEKDDPRNVEPSPLRSDGFDLSDLNGVMERGKKALDHLKELKAKKEAEDDSGKLGSGDPQPEPAPAPDKGAGNK